MESLFKHIERFVKLDSKIKTQIRSICKVKIVEKGTILIKQNQANVRSSYFVVDGWFLQKKKGKTTVIRFGPLKKM